MNDARALSHGAKSSNKGERGITKRLEALARLTPLAGERLLDVGCADGTYTRRLAAGFLTVDAIEQAIRVHDMSASALGFRDSSFDMVTAIEVLEHVADLDGTLSEVHRVLRPGGRFCVTTPNRWFPFETHGPVIAGKRRRPWAAPGLPWVAPLHRRWSDARAFTKGGLSRQAASHGLTLIGVEWMMPPFDRNGLGKKLRPFTDWVERSPLAFFGMALVMVFEKVGGQE